MAFTMQDLINLYEETLMTKEEAHQALGINDSPNYDPQRNGLVIGDAFISDESLYNGEVIKGELVDEDKSAGEECVKMFNQYQYNVLTYPRRAGKNSKRVEWLNP